MKTSTANGHVASGSRRRVESGRSSSTQLLGQLEARVGALRDQGRQRLGVIGSDEQLQPLRRTLGRGGPGWTLVVVLAALAALDEAFGIVLIALGPEVREALGISRGAYGLVITQRETGFMAVGLLMAWLVTRRTSAAPTKHTMDRAKLASAAAFGYGSAALMGVCATSQLGVSIALGSAGGAGGAIPAAHRPMLMDGYPPETRVRVLSLHRAGSVVGVVVAAMLVLALSAAGLSWRGILLVLGIVFTVVSLAGRLLRDPGYGRFDTAQVNALAVEAAGSETAAPADERQQALGFLESVRRLWLIPSVHDLLLTWAVFGALLTPLVTYTFFFLQDHWRLDMGERALVYALASACALPALAWFAPRGDRAFRRAPSQLVDLAWKAMAVLCAGLVLTVIAPWLAVSVLGLGAVFSASAVLLPALTVPMLSVVRPHLRPHAAILAAIFAAGIGGQLGALLLGSVDRRYGPGTTLLVMLIPAVAAIGLLRRTGPKVDRDLDRLVDELIEEQELTTQVARGVRPPLLACRQIDFSYGQVQVLFDVNFTVDEGEMVALLGTNGAGKSTLLATISGLGFPTSGHIYYQGIDITFADDFRRVSEGITQVPGGQAVFGPLSVLDNLRMYGYSHGRDRQAIERGMDAAFAAFPRLAERRSQPASTLSGGEQQMLALSKALILKPRLLLIDELSLGLAPKVVTELMTTVRDINAAGTAVILVEQSVSTALQLVEHAYFMEKGAIRFDGRAADLLDRPDLLRSVFLAGAAVGQQDTGRGLGGSLRTPS